MSVRCARAHQKKALAAIVTGIREKPGSDSELSALEAVARHRVPDNLVPQGGGGPPPSGFLLTCP
ncbi:hypothetical protein SLAV_06535 [Streptomyces lavendulae subsp. lavendulae]|uniref:Uncharacterized protein n=1 Tax=Streptomyces lavendulae subsp. lavendulae TaxID=58340 RepID=A0A2K8P8Z2_STRLA|nr:hypothetical protein [Streptomyces lavendulae]ATZ23212.1 hypothetical protein SLAV_06535 [Streptomyces lavendulae subsp. lavendulae]QUQ53045.1 hypothetical protein SLLC_04550 [Streptomyces lavendulae subsp. lavendulae]